jgi:hypothetical protein
MIRQPNTKERRLEAAFSKAMLLELISVRRARAYLIGLIRQRFRRSSPLGKRRRQSIGERGVRRRAGCRRMFSTLSVIGGIK